jgi:hypothetical protein
MMQTASEIVPPRSHVGPLGARAHTGGTRGVTRVCDVQGRPRHGRQRGAGLCRAVPRRVSTEMHEAYDQ